MLIKHQKKNKVNKNIEKITKYTLQLSNLCI